MLTFYPQTLGLSSAASSGSSVGVAPLRTQATELSFSFVYTLISFYPFGTLFNYVLIVIVGCSSVVVEALCY
jgi:hypothetical protein